MVGVLVSLLRFLWRYVWVPLFGSPEPRYKTTFSPQAKRTLEPARLERLPLPTGLSPPPPGRRKTLVLDLDETLIHSSTEIQSTGYDLFLQVVIERKKNTFYVKKRPHVDLFLRVVSEWYELAIFTAGLKEYSTPIIDWLDDGRGILRNRRSRESCTPIGRGVFAKDITLIRNDLRNVLLVDNYPPCYSLFQQNAIPILTWTSDENDEALLQLLPFLRALRHCEDVRSVLSLRLT